MKYLIIIYRKGKELFSSRLYTHLEGRQSLSDTMPGGGGGKMKIAQLPPLKVYKFIIKRISTNAIK